MRPDREHRPDDVGLDIFQRPDNDNHDVSPADAITQPLLMGPILAEATTDVGTVPADSLAETAALSSDTPGIIIRNVHNLGDIGRGALADFKESKHKAVTALGGLAVIGTQVADRARLLAAFLPPTTIEVLKDTRNPIAVGLYAGSVMLSWGVAVGGFFAAGTQQYPKAVSTTAERYPLFVKGVKKALPGFEEGETNNDTLGARVRSIGHSAVTHLKRGSMAIGVGTTAYSGTAAVAGRKGRELHKTYLKAAVDGGIVMGLFTAGVAKSVLEEATRNPALAERIQNDAGNAKLWYVAAGLLALSQFIPGKKDRPKETTDKAPRNLLRFVPFLRPKGRHVLGNALEAPTAEPDNSSGDADEAIL